MAASAAARLCDIEGGPTEIGYGGARGGGKSFWALAQIGADDCQRQPGLKALLLRQIGKSGRESFEDLMPQVLGGLKYEYHSSKGILIFQNGSRLYLGHYKDEKDIDKYIGIEYDVIGVEEATTFTQTKYKAIKASNRTSKPGWQPRMYATTNPGGIGHGWFMSRFVTPNRRGEEEGTRFVKATARDNQFVNASYRTNLEGLTGWLKRAWLDGDWDIQAGQFFTTFRDSVHVCQPFEIPSDWQVWVSLDYGFTHFTVIHVFAKSNDGVVYLVGEHIARRWLPSRHASALEGLIARLGIARHRLGPILAGTDVFSKDRDGGTVAEDYASLGWPMTPANTDRINGAAEILRRLGDSEEGIPETVYISTDCPRLIECLPAMVHDPNHPEDVLKVDTDDEGSGGDDPYDAFRYGIMHAAIPRSLPPATGSTRQPLASYPRSTLPPSPGALYRPVTTPGFPRAGIAGHTMPRL